MAVVREAGARAYVEGVRKVSWYTGEACEFASALVSAMGALGEEVPYHYVLGTTGVAFRLTLNPDPWNPGSYGIWAVAADPHAVVHRAFAAIGRDFTLHEKGSEEHDTAAIVASIDRGIPVPAFGVVGPADCSLVTGYDQGGKTLLGWSTYQDIPDDHDIPPDVTGYFRKPEWHANTRGYVLIGGKKARPPLRRLAVDSLQWAVHLVGQTAVRDMPAGLRAYEVWADAMLQDRHFSSGDTQVLGGPYLGILCLLMMIDDRRSAAPFLTQIAAELPELAPELLAAADCYRETCRLREGLGTLLKEDFSAEAITSLANPGLRREYAQGILAMRDQDAQAIAHIERCLARTGTRQ